MLPHRLFPKAHFALWVDGKLQLRLSPDEAVRRFLLEPRADFAALRNLRRDTLAQEHSWVIELLCRQGAPPAKREACAAAQAQWRRYEAEQAPPEEPPAASSSGGATAAAGPRRLLGRAPVIEGAFYVADLRAAATHCLLCAWFNEYARFSERDQLSFAYVAAALAPAVRVHLIPRRLHWSVTVSKDTTACYNATSAGAGTIATHHTHAVRG
eukprot:Transcript_14580.p2 GENE.Transcript_14580~~Transcript_14580.p2  ORF type:complete len:212 (-),score=91.87 Transcript_14580:53-688(-)